MSRYSEEYECSGEIIESTMKVISRKWALQIIHEMFFNRTRFAEFKQNKPDLDNKTLSRLLKELQENGIVKKVSDDESNSTRYYLTEKGKGLNRVIYEISAFAIDNSFEIKQDDREKIKNNIKIHLNC
ncbi:MAG: helix-turn-helix transcriptional regulator [Methanobrevibacter sp.]|nr:helix-turn-helix transcriptional regulator [Methanobrevibacter sp.]